MSLESIQLSVWHGQIVLQALSIYILRSCHVERTYPWLLRFIICDLIGNILLIPFESMDIYRFVSYPVQAAYLITLSLVGCEIECRITYRVKKIPIVIAVCMFVTVLTGVGIHNWQLYPVLDFINAQTFSIPLAISIGLGLIKPYRKDIPTLLHCLILLILASVTAFVYLGESQHTSIWTGIIDCSVSSLCLILWSLWALFVYSRES